MAETLNSDSAILDVTKGRKALLKRLNDGPIPVVITGYIVRQWGNDDGTSIEFAVDVTSVIATSN